MRNSFNKAQQLTPMARGVDEEPNFIPELLLSFRALDIAIDNDELDEFMHIDDEKNKEYSKARLDDVNTALAAVQSGEDADTDDEASPGVGKLFVRRATFEKMLQPRAAHSHYKIGKFTLCVKKQIYIKHRFCISHSGTSNAI